jgi:hypothetical protein
MIHFINFDNLDSSSLLNLFDEIRTHKLKSCKQLNENSYQIEISKMYKSSTIPKAIVPNKLLYTSDGLKLYTIMNLDINFEKLQLYKNILDDFIFKWIECEDIKSTKVLISGIINCYNYDTIKNSIPLYERLKTFCKESNKELLTVIGLIFDFYKDKKDDIFEIERSKIKFLKKIKMHNYNFEDIINKFNNRKKSDVIVFQFKRNFYKYKFSGNCFFKTIENKLYKEHKCLKFISFLENI